MAIDFSHLETGEIFTDSKNEKSVKFVCKGMISKVN